MPSMMPGSQSVLDLVEAHFNGELPTELQTYTTTVDDNLALAWRSPFEEHAWRTWSKRIIVDPVHLSTRDVAVKISSILERLPISHEVISTSSDREDLLSISALAERGSQRCVINCTFIRETAKMVIHLLVATGVPPGTSLER